jgi:hypothetical protein
MTAALEGGEWSAARPDRTLPSGKTRYPFYLRLGGLQGRSGRAENLVPTGIGSRTLQPVVSRYTDWATGPTFYFIYVCKSENNNIRGPYFLWSIGLFLATSCQLAYRNKRSRLCSTLTRALLTLDCAVFSGQHSVISRSGDPIGASRVSLRWCIH